MKPRLLDLFSGAGGCARGYQRAGFYVVGVDHKPQPRYAGDEFHQADAMTFPLDGFDAIHASPVQLPGYESRLRSWVATQQPQPFPVWLRAPGQLRGPGLRQTESGPRRFATPSDSVSRFRRRVVADSAGRAQRCWLAPNVGAAITHARPAKSDGPKCALFQDGAR